MKVTEIKNMDRERLQVTKLKDAYHHFLNLNVIAMSLLRAGEVLFPNIHSNLRHKPKLVCLFDTLHLKKIEKTSID